MKNRFEPLPGIPGFPGAGTYTGPWPNVPVIPPLPPEIPKFDPNPVVARCGECGRDLHRCDNYCCPNQRCPIQPRVTC